VLRGGRFLKPQDEPRRLIAQTGRRGRASNRSTQGSSAAVVYWVGGVSPLSQPTATRRPPAKSPESVHERSVREPCPRHHQIEVGSCAAGSGRGRRGWWCCGD
jgi:hypothetical protein